MPKKKTRQQKIITQLKRELEWAKREKVLGAKKKQIFRKKQAKKEKKEAQPHLGLKVKDLSLEVEKGAKNRQKLDSRIYTYDLGLVRKDLTKTLALTMLALSIEILFYFLIER
jgi:hypothetical protein